MAKRRSIRRRFHRPRLHFRHKKSKKIPLLPLIGFGAMLATPVYAGTSIVDDISKGDWNKAMYDARERFICVDNTGKFRMDWILPNYAPLMFGIAAHMVLQRVGVNRYFDKVPVIGKYLSF